MSVGPGVHLGPYEIVAPLGAGGMGQVYRARDRRLNRDVAIKILTTPIGGDSARRERFEREARIVASLNHPHICTLYDVGHDGGHDFLVLEYLEGEPLDGQLARVKGRGLPLAQALAIAIEIADALDKAHRAGIVHRDLKPQNIFVTKQGAKLLDFGLAKLGPAIVSPRSGAVRAAAAAASAAAAAPGITVDGTIIGTFLYMAPEQLAGREADVRTDIFAFGLVLYEMLSGRRPFEDHDDAGVITAVFDRAPRALAPEVPQLPAGLDRLVRACLAKDPDDRVQSAHDLLLQLQWTAEPVADAAVADGAQTKRWRIAAIAAAAIGAAALLRPWLSPAPSLPPPPVVRFTYVMPVDQNFTRAGRRSLALSPDGTRLIYIANRQIYLKGVGDLAAAPVRGTSDDPTDASFSPDGEWILFWSTRSREMRKVPVAGGASVLIGATLNPWGSCWAGDRVFVSEGKDGIIEFPAAGGDRKLVIKALPSEVLYGPELLPDGDTLIFTAKPDSASRWDDAEVVAQSLKTGVRTSLVQGGTDAHYVSSGHLVYVRDGSIVGVPFDTAHLKVTGTPVPLVTGVNQAGGATTGAGFYSISSTGTLVYVPGDAGQLRTLVTVDRSGRETPLTAPPKAYTRARISPDGKRIALDVREVSTDIWLWDRDRETATQLTFDRGDEGTEIWTADSRHLYYYVSQDGGYGISRLALEGDATPERLVTSPDVVAPIMLSGDGRTLAIFQVKVGTAQYEMRTIQVDGDHTPQPMKIAQFIDPYLAVSPDGRWFAYASNASGRSEIYVRRFPAGDDAPIPVSTGGGSYPMWPARGKDLLYLSAQRQMMAVDVTTGEHFTAARPKPLFTANYFTLPIGRPFDVSADGQEFLMIKEQQASRQFIFVQHWVEELTRLAR